MCSTPALSSRRSVESSAARFFRLVRIGRARIIIPLPVIAEWWRGRTDAREEILASCQIVASLDATKAAGIALARLKDVDSAFAIDAIVIATAALLDGIVVTGDPRDFERLAPQFSRVGILSA